MPWHLKQHMTIEDVTSTVSIIRAASVQIHLVAWARVFAETIYYGITAAAWLCSLPLKLGNVGGQLGGNPPLLCLFKLPYRSSRISPDKLISDQETEGSPWKFPYENTQLDGVHEGKSCCVRE